MKKKQYYHDRQLPRGTFAVLKYGSNAWEAWEKRLKEDLLFLEQEG
jgi:hypothetical protein